MLKRNLKAENTKFKKYYKENFSPKVLKELRQETDLITMKEWKLEGNKEKELFANKQEA